MVYLHLLSVSAYNYGICDKVDMFCRYEIWLQTVTTWSKMAAKLPSSAAEINRCWPNYMTNISCWDRKRVRLFIFVFSALKLLIGSAVSGH